MALARSAVMLAAATLSACLGGGPAALLAATPAGAAEVPVPQFSPALVQVRLVADAVRPGGRLGATYIWRNDGPVPDEDYMVFVHFEYPDRDCAHIRFQQDHLPLVPTSAWETGRTIEDGPYAIPVPLEAAEGAYWLHVGLWHPPSGRRVHEHYWGRIEVSASAHERQPPTRIAADEVARRQAALDARLTTPHTLESRDLAFTVSADTGSYALRDKRTGVAWHSSPFEDGFGAAILRLASGASAQVRLGAPSQVAVGANEMRLEFPLAAASEGDLAITARLLPDGRTLEFDWAARGGAEVVSLDLLADALWTTDADAGEVIVPSRLGLLLPADSGEAYLERFETYRWGGCQMEMLGMVRSGSAALVSWDDPYATATIKSVIGSPSTPGGQALATSLRLRSGPVRVSLLGAGGYVEVAHAYRFFARDKGLLATWEDKARRWPLLDLEKLLGAPNVKPFVLGRTLRSSRFYAGPPEAEETVHLAYTFDEAAQVAEHLRRDLGIEKALFVLAGWIRRGYDNQHPDILPAAPECGGDDALADAAARVRRLGYLFGLHDNYQDLYRDAPSFSEEVIMKRRDGSLLAGGNWAGGQAWLICSPEGLKFAGRPQRNLPRVKALFDPGAYFIDTTFASELFDCYDPDHPITRRDDIRYKAALSDFSASLFGVHGSEEGMEWAVPHAVYFEGILTEWEPLPHGARIPLFELVYRDCIALYAHQGDRAYPTRPDYILRHLALGRMPLYAFGPHLYWQEERPPVRARPAVERLEQVGPREFEVRHRWQVAEDVSGDWRVFVHFTRDNGDIVFQGDHDPSPPTSDWRAGETIATAPTRVEVPPEAEGAFDIRVGLFRPASGERALLEGSDDGMRRYTVGRVRLTRRDSGLAIALEAAPAPPPVDLLCLARADGGWGEHLGVTDRFIKNTYEVMSPLNELTARLPMTAHQFLTADRLVQRSVFGDEYEVVVNLGRDNYLARTRGGEALLPPLGFAVWGPQFQAFHALSWQGLDYERPALFAVRALDGREIADSRRLRVFHGFGDQRVRVRGQTVTVETERIIED